MNEEKPNVTYHYSPFYRARGTTFPKGSCLIYLLLLFGVFLLLMTGFANIISSPFRERPVFEGPILYAVYEIKDGRTAGFTRVDNAQAVPADEGSWNEKRYGRLYKDMLIVTNPEVAGWGTLVIPRDRLVSIHFVNE